MCVLVAPDGPLLFSFFPGTQKAKSSALWVRALSVPPALPLSYMLQSTGVAALQER